MTAIYRNKMDMSPQVLTGDLTLSSGWSATNLALTKTGQTCVLSGYLTKTSSIANADVVMTLPSVVKPGDKWLTANYALAHGGATDKTARVGIESSGTTIVVRNPSASMTNLVFCLTWFSAS